MALLFAASILVLLLVESSELKASIAVPLIIIGLIGIMLFVIVSLVSIVILTKQALTECETFLTARRVLIKLIEATY